MGRIKDLTNKTFGRLTVVSKVDNVGECSSRPNGYSAHSVRCECGSVFVVRTSNMTGGTTKSCGCMQVEMARRRHTKHGLYGKSGNGHYSRWRAIRTRTENSNHHLFHRYGGRGISLHHTWVEPTIGFLRFKWYLDTVLGPCPEGCSLDRIDNNGDYEPRNLRWASAKQQRENQK